MTAGHRDLDERGGKTLLETSRTHIHKKKKIKKSKNQKIKKTKKNLMEKNRFHESKKEIQAYRVSSIATRPFHCEVIKATSKKSID